MTQPSEKTPTDGLMPFAVEAKRFWTSFRPKEAATMTDEDFAWIGDQIDNQVWDVMEQLITHSTHLPEAERAQMLAQRQRELTEQATHEHIYSLGPEPEVQQQLEPEDDPFAESWQAFLDVRTALYQLENAIGSEDEEAIKDANFLLSEAYERQRIADLHWEARKTTE